MLRVLHYAALACLAALAHAQTTPAPKPPPELRQLDYFAGKWRCEGVTKRSSVKWASPMQCGWFNGGLVLECRSHANAPNEGEGVTIYGFNAVEKVYTQYSYGSTGADPSVLRGQRTGTTWTYTGEGTFQGKPAKYQYVVNEASASRFSYQARLVVEGGSWTVTQEGDCTKAK